MRIATRLPATAGLLVTSLLLLAWPPVAFAEPPIDVSGPVTDPAGVLGDRAADVREALDEHQAAAGYQLFIVLVPSFDGLDGDAWADESARESRLGDEDLLLAIATDDRAYGLSVADDFSLSDQQVDQVVDEDLLPRLRDGDWGGAAIATADGLAEAGEPGPGLWIGLAAVAALGAGAGGTVLWRRHRQRSTETAGLADLEQRSGSALVGSDEAIRTSEQELAFAEAEFGLQDTLEFRAALTESRDLLTQAFALRQRLDDEVPESAQERRAIAEEIIALCSRADAILDDKVEAFRSLRDLHQRAPEVLAGLGTRVTEVAARLPAARVTLEGLAARYTASAIDTVDDHPAEVERLLAQAQRDVSQGLAAVEGDRPAAVAHARSAEACVVNASALLDGVDGADAALQAAPRIIAERLTAIDALLADAAEHAADDLAVTAAADRARAAAAAARSDASDPLATVATLQDGETALSTALAPAMAEVARAEQARVALAGTIDRVGASLRGVSQYVEAQGTVVGAEARTRLSEAGRHLALAQQAQVADPVTALDEAEQADRLVASAQNFARADVSQADANRGSSSGWGGGGSSAWGGGGSSRRSSSRSPRRSSSSRRSSSGRRSSGSRGGRSRGGRF
ncbi:TPM domain-containing protein [Aeromicrobium sp. Sec7.5]|uniref:TPM domain-containing protein n=1 Tax=Aeromicrobium sp. Sec7.5 TaxID=3121276 RepID=UPI002FE45BE2